MPHYEELNAVISIGYDHEKSTRSANVLSQDGVAEQYLREFGPEHLADELGMYARVEDRGVMRIKYLQNVYRVSATIEIIDGEFGDMSDIKIGEPLLPQNQLYV